MFQFFDDIINGRFQPHLIDGENKVQLKELYNSGIYVDEEGKILKSSDEWFDYCLGERRKVKTVIDEKNTRNNFRKIFSDSDLIGIYNYILPPPYEGTKSEVYTTLIEKETELIKYKINKFINDKYERDSYRQFADHNIWKLKSLAEQLRTYQDSGNQYELEVLGFYIIDIIQYIQKAFTDYLFEIQSSLSLYSYLFHYQLSHYPFFIILPLLPKDKEFDDFKKEFRINHYKELKKFKSKGLCVSECLFNHYKSTFKGFNKDIQIAKYYKVLYFWNAIIITNKLKDEPEIENILIPLLKNEIELLKIDVEKPIPLSETLSEHTPVFEDDNSIQSENSAFLEHEKFNILETARSKREIENAFKWQQLYPDIAKKTQPEFCSALDDIDKSLTPIDHSLSITKSCENIPKWIDSANKKLPSLRMRELVIIKEVLYQYHRWSFVTKNEVVKAALEMNKYCILEGLEIVENALNSLQKIPKVYDLKDLNIYGQINGLPKFMTKHERWFLDYLNRDYIVFVNKSLNFSFEEIDNYFSSIKAKFENEIKDNNSILIKIDRDHYFKRIIDSLNDVRENFITNSEEIDKRNTIGVRFISEDEEEMAFIITPEEAESVNFIICKYKKEILNFISQLVNPKTENPTYSNQQSTKLTLNQIALKYIWEELAITKQNKDEIAKLFKQNSGDGLYNHYCKLAKKSDRIADPESKKKLENKINLFESVIEILSQDNRKRASEELKILQTIYEQIYLQK